MEKEVEFVVEESFVSVDVSWNKTGKALTFVATAEGAPESISGLISAWS
ncbi:hypothetical protein [Mesomycoplasma ovipneumoniae]